MNYYDDDKWNNRSSDNYYDYSDIYEQEDAAYFAREKRRAKRRAVFSGIIAIILLLSICAKFIIPAISDILYDRKYQTESTAPKINYVIPPSGETVNINAFSSSPSEPLRYYRSRLTDNEKVQYDAIANAIANMLPSVKYSYNDVKGLMQMAQYVFYDYPEYFWYEGSMRTEYTDYGYTISGTLFFDYSCSETEKAAMQQEIDAKTANILQTLSTLSDYEKVKTCYEYLINNSKYDLNLSQQGCYPVLAKGRGVCSSYTSAFNYLMGKSGMQTIYASGTSKGENHAWSLVKLSDGWYQVDVTWGDPVTSDGHDVLSYDYLLLDDSEMLKDHQYDNPLWYPACNCLTYNYYRYEGLYLDKYDYDALLNILERCKRNGTEFMFKCANQDVFDEAVNNLFTNDVIWKLLRNARIGSIFQTIQYSADSKQLTVRVSLE